MQLILLIDWTHKVFCTRLAKESDVSGNLDISGSLVKQFYGKNEVERNILELGSQKELTFRTEATIADF